MTAPEPDLTAIRVFRVTLDGRTLHGAQFPSGRVVLDEPDAEAGFVTAAISIEHLILPDGAVFEWDDVVDRLTAERDEARDEASSQDVTIVEMNKALTRVEAERDALREELAKAREALITNDRERAVINAARAWRTTINFGGPVPNRMGPGRHQEDFDLAHAVDALTVVPAVARPAVTKRAILREIVLDLGLTLSEDKTESALSVLIALFASGTHHLYLSTYCLHGTHGECGAAQHERGDLSAPHCKGCDAPCICPRHADPAAPCWGGDQPRRHDPSCALDADHLGWCGPLRANAVVPLMHAIATWYGTRSTPAAAKGDLALAWEEYTDTAGVCEFCTKSRCPECLVCLRCAGDGHSESCSQPDLPAAPEPEADREVTP